MNDDYAAVAMSLYCAHKNKNLYVEGSVTNSALRNLDELIRMWSVLKPDMYSPVSIEAAKIADEVPGRDKPAAIAFSGGVDACFSLAANQTKLYGDASFEIGIGVLMVGFDVQEYETLKYEAACRSATKILEHFGAKLAVISTNFREDFCITRLAYSTGIACVLHTLVNDYSTGLISNANDYLQDLKVNLNDWFVSILNILGTETFPIHGTGGTHNRMERVGFLSQFPVVVNNMRVCWVALDKGTNCGVCSKCVRTRLELIICGKEPDIFNAPMGMEHIELLEFKSSVTFIYMEEIFESFPKEHPYYETVKKVFEREWKKLNSSADALATELQAKEDEANGLKSELSVLMNTKAYKLSAPLRLLKKRRHV